MKILTYEDYINARDKKAFILDAIEEYKNSETYKTAETAQAYYRRENKEILKRLTYLQKHGLINSKVKFHKICSGFFPKFVKQQAQYLLGNGVTLDEQYKNMLGSKFDKDLQRMGIQALVDGVNWGFWNHDKLLVFRATEFCPLFDEQSADLKVGIRFFQIDIDKPLYVELYEEEGITSFRAEGDTLEQISEQKAYIQKVFTAGEDEFIVDTENYPKIPIFPLYANELKQSEFTQGLKSMIDAYDFVNSDLIDGITLVEGVYWIIKNYGGESAAELLTEIQELKTAYIDQQEGFSAEAGSESVEIPHTAKKYALEVLERRMYEDYMALDTKAITGGSLTNVAINVAKTDFDLKADIFEWYCEDFVQNILELLGVDTNDVVIKFKRRSFSNDTETINNISSMLADGYIDIAWAIKNNPLIADEEQEELIERMLTEEIEEAEEVYPLKEVEEIDEKAEVEGDGQGVQADGNETVETRTEVAE